jgi:hypothetical protein
MMPQPGNAAASFSRSEVTFCTARPGALYQANPDWMLAGSRDAAFALWSRLHRRSKVISTGRPFWIICSWAADRFQKSQNSNECLEWIESPGSHRRPSFRVNGGLLMAIGISGEGPTRCHSYSLHDDNACIAADTIGAAAADMSLPSWPTPGTSITAQAQLVCSAAAFACPDWT